MTSETFLSHVFSAVVNILVARATFLAARLGGIFGFLWLWQRQPGLFDTGWKLGGWVVLILAIGGAWRWFAGHIRAARMGG